MERLERRAEEEEGRRRHHEVGFVACDFFIGGRKRKEVYQLQKVHPGAMRLQT